MSGRAFSGRWRPFSIGSCLGRLVFTQLTLGAASLAFTKYPEQNGLPSNAFQPRRVAEWVSD